MRAGWKDALALSGIGSAAIATSPFFAGDPYVPATLMATMAGSAWLARDYGKHWYNRVDIDKREGFVLPSDQIHPVSMGLGGIRVGYTKDHGRPVDIPNELLMRHCAVVGQSGVGKTTLGDNMLWQQMCRGGGFIFIDAKLDSETRDKLGYMAKVTGREDELQILNVDDPKNSNSYNPLLTGDQDEVASRLLNLIPAAENDPGADHYRQAANQALTVIIAALQSTEYLYHFGDLSVLLQSSQALAELERLVHPGSPEERSLKVFLDQFKRQAGQGKAQIDTNRLKDVLGGMSGRIAMFAQGKFGQVFNTYAPEIDLYDTITNNKMLYVMLPSMGKETAAMNLGKMILSDLRTAVYHVQKLKKYRRPTPPFIVFADEMGSYTMSGISRLFEQARSANICMVPAFQSFSQLKQVSDDFDDMIIQNTWNKVYFKFGSKDSPEMASEIIGKAKIWQRTLNSSESNTVNAPNVTVSPLAAEGLSGGQGEAYREMEEFVVSPDKLKAFGVGEALISIGARNYHVNTPLIKFPDDIPEFSPIKHDPPQRKGWHKLHFQSRFRDFLSEG